VLFDETQMAPLRKALQGREGLSHVFIVTDSDESFKAMAAEVREAAGQSNPSLNVVHLHRDYLTNFMINTGRKGGQDVADHVAPAASKAIPGVQA
jgi:adenine-specific DNA-methyltransferase